MYVFYQTIHRCYNLIISGQLFLTLVINALGALGLINGYSQKEVSDRYLTLITPSPTTFSIWSIIYILVILSCILMVIRSDNDYYKNVINRITSLFRFSSLFNILWIISLRFHWRACLVSRINSGSICRSNE